MPAELLQLSAKANLLEQMMLAEWKADIMCFNQQKQVTKRQLFPSGVAAKIHNVEKEDNHTRIQRLSMIV